MHVDLPPAEDGALPAAEPCNAQGLLARDVNSTPHPPLVDASWIRFEGDHIAVHGYCLPPEGDPTQVGAIFAPGVKGELAYPLDRPDVGEHFWYWPNARASGFIVKLDLAGSAPGSDPFAFDFAKRGEGGELDLLANGRVWLPRELSAFVGFPTDADQLLRVQHYSDVQTVGLTGYNAFRRMERVLDRHGVRPKPGLRLLDWGCGHGRLSRHFLAHWPGVEMHGLDIDPQNIRWAAQALPAGRFATTPLWPPAPIESASVDALFGLSVMTHLTAAAQAAWLAELARLLRPGGIAVLTFAGATAVAYSSRWRDPAWWARWMETGFDDQQPDPALAATLDQPEYYRNTYQSEADVRARWSHPFEVVEITRDQFGYQDAAVLRRR